MNFAPCCRISSKQNVGHGSDRFLSLRIDDLQPSPYQPRRHFGEEELEALAQSIAHNGILQPLAVREHKDGYELISGERRLRAAEIAGLSQVPCVVCNTNERGAAVFSLVENLQRASLTFFEEADAIARLIDLYGLTQRDVAHQLGLSPSAISNKLRLLRISLPQRELIERHHLSERHARALLKLSDEDERMAVLEYVITHALTVSETEQYISETTLKEAEHESIRKRAAVFQNTKIFANSIEHTVDTMIAAGIDAKTRKLKRRDFVEYRIRIPYFS